MTETATVAASFRDPSGFVYVRDGVLLRQVNDSFAEDFGLLMRSGLHDELVADGVLVPCESVSLNLAATEGAVAVLRPTRVPTVSYPYEWSFGQLKDAALLTLEAMKRALAKGMVLKDASAYNVQFLAGRPIFIDTLSFEAHVEGEPWVGYRQFCEHFVAPLALMSTVDIRLGKLLRSNINGIPLDLASRLLHKSSRLNMGLAAHVHLHARAQKSGGEAKRVNSARMTKTGLLALVDSLRRTVSNLNWEPTGTTWSEYYKDTNYTDEAMVHKKRLVSEFLYQITPAPRSCWDLGANDGSFSVIASQLGIDTVAWDFDPAAVELAYRRVKQVGDKKLLPLVQDLTNPSPGLGWANGERESLIARGPVDVVLALALVHHLAIGNNVPLPQVVEFFASLGRWAIVEFVPKDDSQVVRMLSGRKDVFTNYTLDVFEKSLASTFRTVAKKRIPETERTLYLLERIGR